MHEQYFTLERIGEIVGKNPATIRTHINRGYVIGQGRRSDKPAGKHERFSVHSLMQFVLAYKIEASGVSVKQAFEYAGQFAHVGGSDFTKMANGQEVRRWPSMPYHHRHGHTYMGMMAGKSAEISGSDLIQLRYHLTNFSQSARTEPMIVIDVTEVFFELCGKLGLNFMEELDAAYPDDSKG